MFLICLAQLRVGDQHAVSGVRLAIRLPELLQPFVVTPDDVLHFGVERRPGEPALDELVAIRDRDELLALDGEKEKSRQLFARVVPVPGPERGERGLELVDDTSRLATSRDHGRTAPREEVEVIPTAADCSESGAGRGITGSGRRRHSRADRHR